MHILIGWFGHESNTFSRNTTDLALLSAQGYWSGEEIFQAFKGTPSYFGGMMQAAEEYGKDAVTLIPTLAVENAGPTLTDACVETVLTRLINAIKKHQNKLDGICLAMHGAGCSQSHNDVESYVLGKIREVVGEQLPITVPLDLHGNITPNMCRLATGLFGIKENPHTDYATTGYEAMRALIRHIKGEVNLHSEVVQMPLVVPLIATREGAYQNLSDEILAYKKMHGLLDLAFFPGFAYSDTPHSRASVFITADSHIQPKAQTKLHAETVAKRIWEQRQQLFSLQSNDAQKAVEKAITALENTAENRINSSLPHADFIVINEEADNPGAGTPGDGIHLLQAMINANLPQSAFAYIYDPETVQQAKQAGIGANINVKLGGKVEDEKYNGKPLALTVTVAHLSDGQFIATTPLMRGIAGSFGETATLRCGHVEIVVASVQNQTYDDRPFVVGGIDIHQKRLLGIKSSQHFKAFYKPLAKAIFPANPAGLSTRNLALFDYRNLPRPVYPLDDDTSFLS